jgi:hypothetical protein
MKVTLIASIVVLAMTTSGNAQQQSGSKSPTVHYTRTQMNQLIAEARTQGQYETLSTYYQEKQAAFSEEAAQEKQEWIRRSQNVVLINAKYPKPVDSARYLYEYYADQAQRAGQLATKYQQLAVNSTPMPPK